MKRGFLCMAVLAGLALAGAKSYSVHLYKPAMLGNSELKEGDYTISVDGGKAVLRNGKIDAEAPVQEETAKMKFAATSLVVSEKSGERKIIEIDLGGTTTKLVLSD